MTTPELIRLIFLIGTAIAFMLSLYQFLFDWNKDELVRTERKVKEEDKKKTQQDAAEMEVQLAHNKEEYIPEDMREGDEERVDDQTDDEPPQEEEQPAKPRFELASRPKSEYSGRGRSNIKSGLHIKRMPLVNPYKETVEKSKESQLPAKPAKVPAEIPAHGVAQPVVSNFSSVSSDKHAEMEENLEEANSSFQQMIKKAAGAFMPTPKESDDFSKIVGLDAHAETALKNSGVDSFNKLEITTNDLITSVLKGHDLFTDDHHITTWREQAGLIVKRDWATLSRYQASLDQKQARHRLDHAFRDTSRPNSRGV